MIKTAEQVGAIIKELRIKANMTQEQLASKILVSSQAVSKWEKGECYPDIQQLGSLCDFFAVSLDYILNGSPIIKKTKTSYRVYEIVENESSRIEITDVVPSADYSISLSILNKTDREIPLNDTFFLLLDPLGNSIEPKRQNIHNYNNVVVAPYLHRIPNFIPPKSSVLATLIYERVSDDGQLWINIPDFLSGTYYVLHSKAHGNQSQNYYGVKPTRDELVDFFNFHFKKKDEIQVNSDYPKITLDMIGELQIPNTPTYFKDHPFFFSDEVLAKVAVDDEYVDWSFTHNYVKDPIVLRQIIKKNFQKLENEIPSGHCGLIKHDSYQDFMDQEIIEFIIKMRAKYGTDYRKWTLDYINDDNIDRLKPEIIKLKYISNAELFNSKTSKVVVNQIIRESNISDINEHQVLKMKDFYKDNIEQETMDFLLSKLPISLLETLTRYKPLMSYDAWSIKKEEFFAKEQSRLDTLKRKV